MRNENYYRMEMNDENLNEMNMNGEQLPLCEGVQVFNGNSLVEGMGQGQMLGEYSLIQPNK